MVGVCISERAFLLSVILVLGLGKEHWQKAPSDTYLVLPVPLYPFYEIGPISKLMNCSAVVSFS